MTNIVLEPPLEYNAYTNGADPFGVNDSTSAILTTLAQAQNGSAYYGIGGVAKLPPGTYKTSASLVIPADSIGLVGSGWGTVIKPASGSNFDVISTPIPGSAGLSGYVRNYIWIEDLQIDCSSMTGSTAGQGNGIHTYGTRYSNLRNIYIHNAPNLAILLDGDNTGPGNNFGYDNKVDDCIFDLCNGNIFSNNCEANDFTRNRFKWCGGTLVGAQPSFGTQDTTGLHLRLGSGYMYATGNVFGKGGTYSGEAIRCSNSGPCRIIGNRFDQVRNQAVTLNGGNVMFALNQLGSPSSNTVTNAIQVGSSNNLIIGNKFDNTAGAIHYSYAIGESGGPFTGNIYALNGLLAGSSGTIFTNATSTYVEFGNGGSGYANEDAIGMITTTTSYTVGDGDSVILCNQAGAITVTIPNPAHRFGRTLTVKDMAGNAATNNITVSAGTGNIDGAASKVINTNYGVLRLVTDGNNWYTV